MGSLYKWQGSVPIPEEGDFGGQWNFLSSTYYVRDVSGKEIAVYDGTNLQQWNVYGLDIIGKIDPSNHRFMYLKDHLGSVRAIIDTTNTVVYAQDYDAWGYPLENRLYDAGLLTTERYKFTNKERDKESGLNGSDGYDYFGARYYNSRIARWGQVEPLLDKFVALSSYVYAINSPLISYDPNGKDPRREHLGTIIDVTSILLRTADESGNVSLENLHKSFGEEVGRYLYTEKCGIIDMKHFTAAAYYSNEYGYLSALMAGAGLESKQFYMGEKSGFAPEDSKSNELGATFGESESINENQVVNVNEIVNFLLNQGIINPDDPRIAPDKVYIPSGDNSPELPKREMTDFLFINKPFYGMNPKNNTEELENVPR